MSNSKLKQIKDVVRNFDARDPRGAMIAIEHILKAKSLAPKQPKPAFVVKVFDDGYKIAISLKHIDDIHPNAVMAAKDAIAQFGQDTFGNAIRDADTNEIVGFEKFGPHKGISSATEVPCDCPSCRLKKLLLDIKGKIDAKRGQTGDLPKGAVAQTESGGCTATAFTNVDELMAYVQGKADTNATDSGSTQGTN